MTMRSAGLRVGLLLAVIIGVGSGAAAANEPRALGFEDPADWQLVAGSGTVSSVAPLSEGAHALLLGGSGWRELKSRSLTLGAVGPSLKLDVGVGASTAGWETLGVLVQIPSAGINWQDLGSKSLAGMLPTAFKTFEYELPGAVRTALSNGAEATFRLAINGNMSVTLDHGSIGAPPPAPPAAPPPGASSSAVCTSTDLVLTDVVSDFRDIWAGRETVATGKRSSAEPTVRLTFNKPVQPQRLNATMVGLTYNSGNCFDAFGDPIAGNTLHEVALTSDFGAEAWQSPLSTNGAAQSAPLDFNVVAFDRLSGVPDVQGALAVGGDATLQSFSVNASAQKPVGLVLAASWTPSTALSSATWPTAPET
jgi:hypothetical protein